MKKKIDIQGSFKKRLIVLFLLISIVPLTLLTLFNYSYTLTTFKKQTYQNDQRILNKIAEDLDSMLRNVEDRLYSFYIADLGYITAGSDEDYMVALSARIHYEQQILYNGLVTSDRIGIENLSFYNDQDKYLVDALHLGALTKSGEELDWYSKALSKSGELCWVPPDPNSDKEGANQLQATILMKDHRGKIMGAVCAQISAESVLNQIKDTSSGVKGFTAIVDGDGNVVSSSMPEKEIHEFLKNNFTSKQSFNKETAVIQGEKYQITAVASAYTNWHFVAANSQAEISKQILGKTNIFGGLLIFSMVFAIIFAFFISNSLYKPIKCLKTAMQTAEKGDFNVNITEKRNDEFETLYNSFNCMMEGINKMVRELYELKLMKKEAELKVLQSQINPHFLYNTLDSMYWMCQLQRNDELADMISAFSKYLKINLSKGRDIIPIKSITDEIAYYIKIQQYRFGDKIQSALEIDPILNTYSIIKFLLQPLVENAIFHGLEPKKEAGTVKIIGSKDENFAEFSVEDNGVGMEPEQVKRLQRIINYQDSSDSYALYNVNQRLIHTYGEESSLQVKSTKGLGTKISFRIPLIPYEEKMLETSMSEGGQMNV